MVGLAAFPSPSWGGPRGGVSRAEPRWKGPLTQPVLRTGYPSPHKGERVWARPSAAIMAGMTSPIRKAAIVGGGVIGGGWAARLIQNGIDVAVSDPDPEAERKIGEVIALADRAWARLTMAPPGAARRSSASPPRCRTRSKTLISFRRARRSGSTSSRSSSPTSTAMPRRMR